MERKQKRWNLEKLITPAQILHEGEKASLISLPSSGPFAGFKMWYPNRLIKYGHPYVSLIFKDGMQFHLYNGTQEKVLSDKQFLRVQTCEDQYTGAVGTERGMAQ